MSVVIRKDIPIDEIYQKARIEKQAKIRSRMLGIATILEGRKRSDAAKIAGVTINVMRIWVRRFNEQGFEEMSLHLHEVSKTADINTHIVMIMDRAPWHKSVAVPDNISIMFLPPYSPELNPVEQVWDYLRSNYFSNRCYETIESVFDACCEAWELFSNQPALITSIGMRSWFI